MVVMAIIAVLAVLIIGAVQIARHSSTETSNRGNGKTIQTYLEAYYAKNKSYCGAGGPTCGTTYDATSIQAPLGIPAGAVKTTCTGTYNNGASIDQLGGTTYRIRIANWDCSALLPNDTYSN